MAAHRQHKQRQTPGIQTPYLCRKLQSLPKSSPLLSFCLLLIAGSLTHGLVVSMPGIREFPDSQIPSSFSDRISPLSPVMALRFLWYIKTGVLSSFSGLFCQFARLECNSSVPQPLTLEENIVDFKESAEKSADKSELFVGNQINLPDLRNNLPPRAFLPRILANSLPLTNESLPSVMQTLNIPLGSPLSHHMERTLSVCDQTASKQAGTCVTSLEAMVEFATSGLGSSAVEILQSSRSVTSSTADKEKRMTIREMKERRKGAIVCRELMFPFLVFSCEARKYNNRAVEVKLESSDGDEMKAVVECRLPLLSGKEEEECRWVATDSVVWVLKDEEETDAAEPRAWVNQKFHHSQGGDNIITITNNVGGPPSLPPPMSNSYNPSYPSQYSTNQYPMNPKPAYSNYGSMSPPSMSSSSSSLNSGSSSSSSLPSSSSSDSGSTSSDSSGLSGSDSNIGSSKSNSTSSSDDSLSSSNSKSSRDPLSSKSSSSLSSGDSSGSDSSSDSLSNSSSSSGRKSGSLSSKSDSN